MLLFGNMGSQTGCVTGAYRVTGPTRQSFQKLVILCLLTTLGLVSPLQADIVWEDHYSDEAVLVNGSSFTTSTGANVTINTSVYSDSDGGTWDLSLYGGNSDYITFESGQTGAHTGFVEFAMDNQNNDPADYVELTLSFDRAITNLQFSLLDVDSGSWDDGVEVFYNGSSNARDSSGINVTHGSANGLDNESYMHGWEGFGSGASNNQTTGNINFDFNTLYITSLRIRFFSTDDANSNPGGQFVGLSDMTFTNAVPETASTPMMAIFCLMAFGMQLACRKKTTRESGGTNHPSQGVIADHLSCCMPRHRRLFCATPCHVDSRSTCGRFGERGQRGDLAAGSASSVASVPNFAEYLKGIGEVPRTLPRI